MAMDGIKSIATEAESLLILETKCRPPLVPDDIVLRPRLFKYLNDWQARRLTVIQAPPGYGKTMLVASWLKELHRTQAEQGSDVVWVSLDEDDDDPRQFLAYIASALKPIIPSSTHVVEQHLRQGQADLQRAIKILLNGISGLANPLLFIVDDYHHINDEGIHQAFKLALERGPTNLHLMLLTRQNLPHSLGHMSNIGGLQILGLQELRFQEEELAGFVEKVLGCKRPSKAELSSLMARSDGWIAGLKLAAVTRPSSEDVDSYTELLHGQNKWLSTFFRSEFLAEQPARLQTFLLQTSILEQLTVPLCAAVTGMPETESLLKQAVASNLFITPTDVTRSRFTYHDLFRELLMGELERSSTTTHLEELGRRAAEWLEDNGEIEAALRQYLRVGLDQAAISLVERHSLPSILAGDLHNPQRWLNLLKKSAIPFNPRLLLDQGWIYLIADRLDTLAFLQSTSENWRALTGPPLPDDPCQQERMMQLSIAHYLAGDSDEALAIITKIGSNLSDSSHFLVRGGYHHLNFIILQSSSESSKQHGQQALQIYQDNGWLSGMIAVTRYLGIHARLTGDVQEALKLFHNALRLINKIQQDLTLEAIYLHFHLAQLLYDINQLDEARDELHQMIAKSKMLEEADFSLLGRIVLDLCNLVDGNGKLETLSPVADSVAWQEVIRDTKPLRKVAILSWLIRYWIIAEKYDRAWQAAGQLQIKPDDSPGDHPSQAIFAFLSGYLAHGANLVQLEPLLKELKDTYSEMNGFELHMRLTIIEAWYWLKRGDETKARAYMKQALDMVLRTGYVRFVLDIPALNPLLAEMDHPALNTYPELSVQSKENITAEAFTKQEIKILSLLAKRRKNAEIGEELFITVSTVKWYLWQIYQKLGVKNRRQAVDRARELGLIRGQPAA
jgi:LuxR family maltose regulon positive regulatory protein